MTNTYEAMSPHELLAGIEDPGALYEQTIATVKEQGVEAARLELAMAMGTITETRQIDAPRHRLFANIVDRFQGSKMGQCLAAATVCGGLALASCGGDNKNTSSNPADLVGMTQTNPNTEKSEEKCADTWSINKFEPTESGRFIISGSPEIKKAKTKEDARDAAAAWLDRLKQDPQVFASVYEEYVGGKIDVDKLFDKKGCSTDYAVEKANKFSAKIANSKVTVGQVPSNWTNTGLNSRGEMVRASQAGISGNRHGLILVNQEGVKMGVLARCAQPAFETPPKVPEGPTDNPRIKFPPRPDRKIPPVKQPGKACPPGSVPHKNRCVHPLASGPPRGVSQEPHKENDRRTPGYNIGNAENVANQQDREKPGGLDPTPHGTQAGAPGSSPGGGNQSVVSAPDATAPSNPAYTGGESQGTNAGTSDSASSPDTQTQSTGTTSGANSGGSLPGATGGN